MKLPVGPVRWLLVAALVAASGSATLGRAQGASVNAKCAIEKYRAFSTAQAHWQTAVTDLVLANAAANLKPVATRYHGEQMVIIERRRLELEHTLAHAPDKARLDGPVQQWSVPGDADRAKVAQSSPRYAELLRLEEAARKQPPHPDGDALRMLMRDRIAKLPAFRKLMADLDAAVARANGTAC